MGALSLPQLGKPGEHLCLVSSILGWSFLPGSVLGDEGIGEDDKLSRDRDESDLGFFATLPQASVKRLQSGVPLTSADGGEVEHSAEGGATSPNNAFAVVFARLVGDRRKASEHGDLLVRQRA